MLSLCFLSTSLSLPGFLSLLASAKVYDGGGGSGVVVFITRKMKERKKKVGSPRKLGLIVLL